MTPVESETRHRRDEFYIMSEILEVTLDGALKTQVMYRANLSFAQLNVYLDRLKELRFLESKENYDRTYYHTTPKGIKFLKSYRETRSLLTNEEQVSSSDNHEPLVARTRIK